MSATMDADESYFTRDLVFAELRCDLMGISLSYCTMNNIGVTINMTDPFICA